MKVYPHLYSGHDVLHAYKRCVLGHRSTSFFLWSFFLLTNPFFPNYFFSSQLETDEVAEGAVGMAIAESDGVAHRIPIPPPPSEDDLADVGE